MSCYSRSISLATACLLVAFSEEAVRAQRAETLSYRTPCYLEFSDPNYTASPDATNAVITVVRTGEFRESVSVDYASSGGTATAGVHYLPVSGTLSIPAGVGTGTFLVRVFQDHLTDGPKTIALSLSNPGPNGLLIRSNATLLIGSSMAPNRPAPVLSVRPEGGSQVVISWLGSTDGWILQKSEDPSSSHWRQLMTTAATVQGYSIVREPAFEARFFYRLRAEAIPPRTSP